jgi:hypothetical protein
MAPGRRAGVGAMLLALAAWPLPGEAAAWPDSLLTRVEALALLETLNADLLSHPSATLTLERWCGAHHLAPEARVIARLVRGADKPLPEADRTRLALGDGEAVRYRRVQLLCGDHVLSEADNWYVPSRLTPEMNRLLDETDTPFGKAVQALGVRRETLSAALLWSPLPEGWEMAPPAAASGRTLAVPAQVLQHRAVLFTRDGVPFSEVVETYTGDVLDFPPPVPPR